MTAWFGIALIACFAQIVQPALANGKAERRWSQVEESVAALFRSAAEHRTDDGTGAGYIGGAAMMP